MKGIILSGGVGSRLFPLTYVVSKQLLPVYDKPMIYYPLMTLIDMGINNILIIVADNNQKQLFENQLLREEKIEANISYIVQGKPRGLADAFILGEEFIGNDDVALILGDNILISNNKIQKDVNSIFTYKVKNPSAYGVVKHENGKLLEIVEKPKKFISNDAVIGLYIFDNRVIEIAKNIKPSDRGELEIVDVIRGMNSLENIKIHQFDGYWFDCGTHDDLLACANLIKAIKDRNV